MKANELMIGDLVQIAEPSKYAGAIGRIKTLIDHKDEENAYFKVYLQKNMIHIGIKDICSEDIRPIPLEKIHLVKNGFTADEEDETFIYEDGYEVRISFDGGCKELELEPYIYLNINFAEKHLSMEIENLHQLQQAMRLMDCDKKIKL